MSYLPAVDGVALIDDSRQGVGLALRGGRTQRDGGLPAGGPPWVDGPPGGRNLIIGQIRAQAIGRERAGTTRVDADRCVAGVGIAAGQDDAKVALDLERVQPVSSPPVDPGRVVRI